MLKFLRQIIIEQVENETEDQALFYQDYETKRFNPAQINLQLQQLINFGKTMLAIM